MSLWLPPALAIGRGKIIPRAFFRLHLRGVIRRSGR
jgi:hypothetical protein